MKITDLKSYLIQMDWDDRTGGSEPKNTVAREFVFVQIDTDEGITGWGRSQITLVTWVIVLYKNIHLRLKIF